jgi:hypothetical protein
VLRRRPDIAAAALLLVGLAAQTLLKRGHEWNEVYVLAGRLLLAGKDIYGEDSSYLYPPFAALLATPFSIVPPLVSRALWFALNALAMVVMVRVAWSLAGGSPVQGIRDWEKREWIAVGLGLACGMGHILNAFAHAQTDVVVGALMLVGCAYLLSPRSWAGGALIGIAAAFKATPLLWLPYLLLRRRFLAGLLVGVVAIGVNLIPDLVFPSPTSGTWLGRWAERFVLPSQQLTTPLGTWGSDLIFNQSLGGTTQRIINTTLASQDGKLEVVVRPRVGTLAIKLTYYLLLALLLVVSVAVILRASTGPPDRSHAPVQPIVFEFGMVVTLMLLMSPMSSKAHFGTLILPGFCLARYALAHRDRVVGFLVVSAAILGILANKDLVGAAAYTALLWMGAVTIETLLLWLGCVLALARGSAAPVGSATSGSPA